MLAHLTLTQNESFTIIHHLSALQRHTFTSRMPSEIQFIHSNPLDRSEPASRKRAHAHAARVAHAKRPRFRVVEYPSGTKRTTVVDDEISTVQKADRSGIIKTTEVEIVCGPTSLLSSARSDPFNSFARTFTNVEHFLLDHC